MPVLLSTYGARGDIEPMVGLAVRVRVLGVQCDTVAALVAEGSDAQVSACVMPRGAWL
jgi:vancomycin aglycone glucosyltransferase